MSALLQNDLKHIYQLFLIHLTYSYDYLIVIYFVSKIKLGFLMRTGQKPPRPKPPLTKRPPIMEKLYNLITVCAKNILTN